MKQLMKIMTLLRGGARETLDGVIDANGLRILAQEVCDYEQALLLSKRELTQRVAERMRMEKEVAPRQQRILQREKQLADALGRDAGEDVQALAEWIADEEESLRQWRDTLSRMINEEQRFSQELCESGRELLAFQRELRLLKTQTSPGRGGGKQVSSLGAAKGVRDTVLQSLDRLRQQQQVAEDYENAARTLDEVLSANPMAAIDRVEQQRQKQQAAASVIARVKLMGAVVRPV